MEFLQATVRFLEEENRELKDRVKRVSDLNHLITQQRETEERDYLQKFHQEEIAVIREIAQAQQQSLKNQIKQLSQEVTNLHFRIQQDTDTIIILRRQIKQKQDSNTQLQEEVGRLQRELQQARKQQSLTEQLHHKHYAHLDQQYRLREQQIITKYAAKLQKNNDQNQQEIRKQGKFVDFLQNKLNASEHEKALLSQEVAALIETLKQEQLKVAVKSKVSGEEAADLRRENNNLKVYIKNLQLEIADLQNQKNREGMRADKLQKQCGELRAKQKEVQRSKDREIERQKFKNKSISKDLSQQKKLFKEQLQKQKRKEMDYSHSKKLLISKIKQIQSKYEHAHPHNLTHHSKGTTSILDKTTTKTVKKSLESFQSISLDNSFNKEKESPSVSCFLKEETQIKPIQKKPLMIQTGSLVNLLSLKDLDTPCFESSKAKNVKRTIKIRK